MDIPFAFQDIRRATNPTQVNFAGIQPRFGVAWDVKGDGKTAVRAGFGRFMSRSNVIEDILRLSGNPPWTTAVNSNGPSQNSKLSDDPKADIRVALLHYSPVPATLQGERLEIYPFLGSYLLAEAIDRSGADLVIHGHAHGGSERGVTPAGIRVRNVAQPVIRSAYRVYCFGDGDFACDEPAGAPAPA